MSGSQKQDVRVESKVDNRGAEYNDVRNVYNAPVTHQTIVKDNSITYEVDHEDVDGIEKLSLFVMRWMGETPAKVIALASILLGGGSVYVSVNQPAPWLARYTTSLMLFGVVGIGLAVVLFTALQFKANSRCVKCNRFYAMNEHGSPKVKEVPRRGGAQRSITRFYQCMHCGNEVAAVSNEFIEDEPEDS